MRILVTGSRNWTNKDAIEKNLFFEALHHPSNDQVTLVSGNCPTGADAMAERFARLSGWNVELHPADWNTHGKKAGFLRNAEMVALGADAHTVLR